MNGHIWSVLSLFSGRNNSEHEDFGETLDSLLFLKAHAAFSSALFGSCSFFLLHTFLILEVFTTLHFSLDGFLVIDGSFGHAGVKGVLNDFVAIVIFNHLKLNLLVEGGHKVCSHRVLLSVAQEAHVLERCERVALEVLQELL